MKSRVNFLSSYTATNKLINTDFLRTKIGLNQYLYINNKTNLRQEYLKLISKNKEYTLSVAEKYHYSNLTLIAFACAVSPSRSAMRTISSLA